MEGKSEFTQNGKGFIPYYLSYLVVTLIPLILISAVLLAVAKSIIEVTLIFFILFIITIPIDLFVFILPFKRKINMSESIALDNKGLNIKNGESVTFVSYESMKSITFLNYFIDLKMFTFSLGNFVKNLGIFKLTTEKGDYFLPQTYLNRDILLQKIIKAAHLKKQPPTTETNISSGFLTWQRDTGLFYSWQKSDEPVNTNDLIITIYTKSETIIGYFAVVTILIALILLILLIIAPNALNLPF